MWLSMPVWTLLAVSALLHQPAQGFIHHNSYYDANHGNGTSYYDNGSGHGRWYIVLVIVLAALTGACSLLRFFWLVRPALCACCATAAVRNRQPPVHTPRRLCSDEQGVAEDLRHSQRFNCREPPLALFTSSILLLSPPANMRRLARPTLPMATLLAAAQLHTTERCLRLVSEARPISCPKHIPTLMFSQLPANSDLNNLLRAVPVSA